jgi:hypothetical protein
MVSHGPGRKSPFGGMTGPGADRNMRLPDFPLNSPRHLRRPFSAATGSGRFAFFGILREGNLKVWVQECRKQGAWASR